MTSGAMMAQTSVLWICAFVVAGVFAIMIHSIATFRRNGERPSAAAEIFWAIVPIFIMVSAALPAARMIAADQATCCGSGSSRTAFNADRK